MIMKTVADFINNKHDINVMKDLRDVAIQVVDKHDTYFNIDESIKCLKNDYETHRNLIIAYDYDDTVKPSKPNYTCDTVIKLLQICTKLQFTMICFTARSGQSDIEEVRATCKSLGIGCDYINEDCDQVKQEMGEFQYAHKIFYNIFLDNRAGLGEACKVLVGFLEWFMLQSLNQIDKREEGY